MTDVVQPNADAAKRLFDIIVVLEKFSLGDPVPGMNHADREWILSTFARCILATQGAYARPK